MEKLYHLLSYWMEPATLAHYSEYLLLFVFVYSFLEVVFPPVPGDALLVLSGSIAGIVNMNPIWVVGCAVLGSTLGSALLFDFGYRMEHRLLHSPRFSWLIDSKGFAKVENWFKRFGYLTLLVSRFIPVIRSGVILAAGMVNLDRKKSIIAVSISLTLWTSMLIFGGRTVGRNWGKIVDLWYSPVRGVFIGVVIIFVLYIVITKLWNWFRNRKQRTDHE